MDQESAFSPILSAFYIAFIFHIFEKRSKTLLTPIPFLFLDNGFFVSQKKSYEKSNINLFDSYSIILSLFNQFSLVIKYNKSEVFHFSKLTKNTNLFPLDLRPSESPILQLKDTWQYLSFFTRNSLFINIFITTLTKLYLWSRVWRCWKIQQENYLCLTYKWLLYRICVFPITLYEFQLWYFKETSLYHPLKKLKKMQRRVTL